MQKYIRSTLIQAPIILALLAPSASADTMDMFVTGGRMAVLCFDPPTKGGDSAIQMLKYKSEEQVYAANKRKFAVCRVGGHNLAATVAVAADIAKFSLLEATQALLDIETALNLESKELNALLEKVKAMKSSDIDYADVSDRLSAEALKISAFNMDGGTFTPSTELATMIRKAEERLDVAFEYLTQSGAATVYVSKRVIDMSGEEKKSFFTRAAAPPYRIKSSFIENGKDLVQGLGNSLQVSITASKKVSKAKIWKKYPVPGDLLKEEHAVTEAKAEEIIGKIEIGL